MYNASDVKIYHWPSAFKKQVVFFEKRYSLCITTLAL
jgi:hypothetical protein